MESGFKRILPAVLVFFICSVNFALAQNPRAVEDIKAFQKKAEEGDSLFNQKKYSEAATALAAAHDLYQRAERRDPEIGRVDISLKPGTFPATRYYGYGFGPNASLSFTPNGAIEGSAAGLHSAMTLMWMDAAVLSGADKIPLAGALNDPPMVDMSEDQLNSIVGTLYGPVSTFKLPVPDDEWQDVVLWSRRAKLIVEYALQKYPAWKSGTREWSNDNNKLQHTGDEALADIRAKLAEAEPEYAKLMSDFKNAAPKRVADWLGYKIEDIDKAIAGVKQNGWVDWPLARDLFITRDYMAGIRKAVAPMYAEEGKTMPADALKPLEDKVAELKSQMTSNASRWKFPAGKKNAALEAKVAAAVKSKIPGATVLKTALDTGEWIITKNDLDLPKYRSMGVLVLAKVPGQAQPWLFFGYVRQTYAGGGTYNSGGTVGDPSSVRIQLN
jgi:hypothetical protein